MKDMTAQERAEAIRYDWENNPRWDGVTRDYTPEDVVRLQGSFTVDQTLASRGARRLWELLSDQEYVHAL